MRTSAGKAVIEAKLLTVLVESGRTVEIEAFGFADRFDRGGAEARKLNGRLDFVTAHLIDELGEVFGIVIITDGIDEGFVEFAILDDAEVAFDSGYGHLGLIV